MERTLGEVSIPVRLVDGAGLRGEDWVTVTTGGKGFLIHPPKDKITIDEQKLGEVLTGRLLADIVKEKEGKVLVEIRCVGEVTVKLWVEKESGNVVGLSGDVKS